MITTAQASRDQFLQLLVAQVRNQDPLEPVGQEEFIAQLAQFSTLEGIEKLNSNFESMLETNQAIQRLNELTQGESLIGRTVQYTGSTGFGTSEGTVEAVEFNNHAVSVVVGGESVSVDRINRVSA